MKKVSMMLLMVAAMTVGAGAVPVVYNSGFEMPDTLDFDAMPTLAEQGGAGWIFGSAAFQTGVQQEQTGNFGYGIDAVDGEQVGYLWCAGDEISQWVNGFEVGTTYDITWSETGRVNYTPELWVLMDGDTLMADHAVSINGAWTEQTVQFTATATSHNLRFYNSGGWDQMVLIDAVSIEVIPEPMTMILLGMGGLALIRRRKSS